jgi:signal transduction histidine kinase
MKAISSDSNPLQNLRARAEQALKQTSNDSASLERDPMLRELRLHELELRMQNEALRELHVEVSVTQERYRELFMRAPVPYLVLDHTSKVLDANLAASALLQLQRPHLAAPRLSVFVDAAHVERFARHMRATLAADEPQNTELILVLPDSARRDVRFESARDPMNPKQWRVALIDLTEIRQLERQLERSQRLEAIGTFAAGVAHDFSNLLAVVSGGADLALELVDVPDLATMPLDRIKRATNHGRKMVRQLLRFASGPESDSTGIFKLDAAVRGAEQALRQLVGGAIDLRLQLNAPNAEVCLDLGGPEEILLNLASNAIHAMPEGGELRIETRTVVANVGLDPRLPPQAFALLTVSDNGRGMDPRTQARAFEPFFTTKSAGHGTGLGLAMVYGIVKRGGGHIRLTSELRKGTSFQIYLPLCSEPDVASCPPNAQPDSGPPAEPDDEPPPAA